MSDKTTSPLYLVCAYFIVAGISFLLSPILAYLLFMVGLLLVGIGFIIDIILCLLLWWAGFEGGIGMALMHVIDVPSPLTAWIVFMVMWTALFLFFVVSISTDFDFDYRKTPHTKVKIKKIDRLADKAKKELSPAIKELEEKYRNRQISKDEVVDSLYNDFNKWTSGHYLSRREWGEIWTKICHSLTFI